MWGKDCSNEIHQQPSCYYSQENTSNFCTTHPFKPCVLSQWGPVTYRGHWEGVQGVPSKIQNYNFKTFFAQEKLELEKCNESHIYPFICRVYSTSNWVVALIWDLWATLITACVLFSGANKTTNLIRYVCTVFTHSWSLQRKERCWEKWFLVRIVILRIVKEAYGLKLGSKHWKVSWKIDWKQMKTQSFLIIYLCGCWISNTAFHWSEIKWCFLSYLLCITLENCQA